MKTSYFGFFCAAVLFASSADLAWAFDDLDELLNSEPGITDAMVLDVTPDTATAKAIEVDSLVRELSEPSGLTPSAPADAASRDGLRPLIGSPATSARASVPSAKTSDPKTAEPVGGLSMVPEPSAIALAAVALIYFLLFGRRRDIA